MNDNYMADFGGEFVWRILYGGFCMADFVWRILYVCFILFFLVCFFDFVFVFLFV